MIRASAPGKLMLAGEYGVLRPDDGIALATAVNNRLTVSIDPGGDDWRVTSPDVDLENAPTSEVPIIQAALDATPGCPQGGLIIIESELGAGSNKPGLGGSAALTVATLGALKALTHAGTPTFDEAFAVHRQAQGGRGSGYDVAVSLHGGLIAYDRAADQPTITSLDWPDGLYSAVLFTGRGASTPTLIGHVESWRMSDPEQVEHQSYLVTEATRRLVKHWIEGEPSTILDHIVACQEELMAFDEAGVIGIFDGEQTQLLTAIEDTGAIGRTSGAGGGDCVWALSDREEHITQAIASAEANGYSHLDITHPAPGLELQ